MGRFSLQEELSAVAAQNLPSNPIRSIVSACHYFVYSHWGRHLDLINRYKVWTLTSLDTSQVSESWILELSFKL